MDVDAYYSNVRSAYDRIAPVYDDSAGKYAVSRRAKQLALRIVRDFVPPGGRLLDVGCYTGIEALLLAQQGYRVVGVDLSPEMVRLARAKAANWHLQDRTEFEALRACDLGRLKLEAGLPFDAAYSVYGTLNLEPQLAAFKTALHRMVKKDGAFICGLLNPTVLYELLLAPLRFQFHGYRKLAKVGVKTRIGTGDDVVPAFLYTPGEFASLMEPEFRLERVLGLHVLYPPPRRRDDTERGLWWIARALDGVELRIETRYPFTNLGFFSLLVFRRSGG